MKKRLRNEEVTEPVAKQIFAHEGKDFARAQRLRISGQAERHARAPEGPREAVSVQGLIDARPRRRAPDLVRHLHRLAGRRRAGSTGRSPPRPSAARCWPSTRSSGTAASRPSSSSTPPKQGRGRRRGRGGKPRPRGAPSTKPTPASPRTKTRQAQRKASHDPVEKKTAREVFDYVIEQGRKEYQVQRYKGLGEMTAPQLWETTMDPERRTLLQVKLEDIAATEDDLHHADGRRRRSAPQVHRRERARREEPGHLIRTNHNTKGGHKPPFFIL